MSLFKFQLINKFLFFTILLIICIPNQASNNFNGLPFASIPEFIYIIFILPILFFVADINKKNKYLPYVIYLIIFVKAILIFAPTNGIQIKQYASEDQLINDKFIKTYNSFWNSDISFLQISDWKTKQHFPIDWKPHSIDNLKDPSKGLGNENLYFTDSDSFQDLALIYKINFFIEAGKDLNFLIKSNGVDNKSKISYKKIDQNIENNLIYFAPNEEIILKKGIYKIEGILNYSGRDWSLSPQIKFIDKKNYISVFKKKNVFASNHYIIKNKLSYITNFLGSVYDILLFILVVLIFFTFSRATKENLKYVFISATFFSFFLIMQKWLNSLGYSNFDNFGSSIISLYLIFCVFLVYLLNKKFNIADSLTNNLSKTFFLILAPVILYFFIDKYFYKFGLVNEWSWGDDWDIFELYAREIVVYGNWFEAGEETFYFRPAPRYVFAILHIIFGHSFMIIPIVEVWMIILSSYYFAKLCINIQIDKSLSLVISILLLVIFFGENYRWIIGRGLSEWYALFLIMISTYYFTNKNLSIAKLILLSFIGGVGTWFREDHGLIIVALIFFHSFDSNEIMSENLFINLKNFIKKNFYKIFLYSFLVSFFFLLMFLRNYILSGEFNLFTHPNVVFERDNFMIWHRMFANSDWPLKPRPTSIILILGFIIAIASIFKFSLVKYKLYLPISIFAILMPYLYLKNMGYAPRYTIHYLPFCILIITIFASNLWLKFKKK